MLKSREGNSYGSEAYWEEMIEIVKKDLNKAHERIEALKADYSEQPLIGTMIAISEENEEIYELNQELSDYNERLYNYRVENGLDKENNRLNRDYEETVNANYPKVKFH